MKARGSSPFWRDERGQSITIMALFLLPVLLLAVGLLVDLSHVAVGQVRAQDAVDLAAQDAAKELDVGSFTVRQEVRLHPGALQVAQARVREYTGGDWLVLTQLSLFYPDARHVAVYVAGEVEIPTRFLWLLGIRTITRRVEAIAVPALGITGEGQ